MSEVVYGVAIIGTMAILARLISMKRRIYNAHTVGLFGASWGVDYDPKPIVRVFLNNLLGSDGHIACGQWFSPEVNLMNQRVRWKVDVKLDEVDPCGKLERIALVMAFKRNGKTHFLELDVWDGENVELPITNENLLEIKHDQMIPGEWFYFDVHVNNMIYEHWGFSDVLLESCYLVIETDCNLRVTLHFKEWGIKF